MKSEPGPAGRPRDPQKDQDALAATRELLAEVGFQRTTIAAIARRSGVAVPAIYRRWPHREALIEDAVFGHVHPAPLPPQTDNLRDDLRAWVELFLAWLADPVTRAAVPGMMLAWQNDEGLYKRFLLRNERDVRALFAERLAAAGVHQHVEAAFDFLVNTTMVRTAAMGATGAAEYCDRTADALAALLYSSWPGTPE